MATDPKARYRRSRRLIVEAEERAAKHFDDVERAIADERLGELLRDLPPVEEQVRQAKEASKPRSTSSE